jgi:cytochrome P450
MTSLARTGPGGAPALGLDPFAAEFLREPSAWHPQLLDAGPVFWLAPRRIWGMARHAQVAEVLGDWETYCSSAGVGLSDFRTEPPWRPPSLLLEADPPEHSRARKVVARVLSPRTVRDLRGQFSAEAGRLLAGVVARGEADGVRDIAEELVLRVLPPAVGLSGDCREPLLAYGDVAFNAFGPRNDLLAASMTRMSGVAEWIAAHCARGALAPRGLGGRIYASAARGALTEEEAGLLVRSLLTAGIAPTVAVIGSALACLAANPAQWELLRADPALAASALEETVRYASPVQAFFRTTTRPVQVGGVTIGAGDKVLLFLGAANRDPRRWDEPGRFDILRRAAGHLGFGYGIHACAGAALGRAAGEALLQALARQVRVLEPAGEPVRLLSNTLSGYASLPLRLR